MYSTFTGLMFAAYITVHALVSLTSFGDTMHLVRHNSAHYGLWVNCYFFTIYMYKHCFLPQLLVFAMNCCCF